MTKREYVLKLLEVLLEFWPMAKGLKILVESNSVDESVLDAIILILKNAVNTTLSNEQKAKLQKGIDFLEKLKKTELVSQEKDAADIANLDNLLETL